MKKYQMKLTSAIVIAGMAAASLAGCGNQNDTGVTANAENAANDTAEAEKTETLAKAVTDGMTSDSMEAGKDETVYVVLNGDGSVSDITVNDVLKNIDSGEVKDSSELTGIQNIKGDEAYTGSTDSMVWNGNGNDITYQGNIKKDLPVDVKISYTLDGKDVTAEQLAGASGHVTMKYEYTNNTETTADVNGKDKKVIVPFVIASGMLLSSDKCSNVTVDNGKVIEEGKNIVVVGYALPGIKDCIASQVDDEEGILDKFDIPESVTIEADVTDFEQDMSLSVALPNILSDTGDKKLDYTDITDKMEELEDASAKLVDGTSKLDNGVKDLKTGSEDLNSGAKELNDGAKDLKNGAGDIKDGASKLDKGAKTLKKGTKSLKDGVKQISDGSGKLNDNSSALKSGADTVVKGIGDVATGAVGIDTAAGQIKTGVETIDKNMAAVNDGAQTVNTGIGTLKAGFEGDTGAVTGSAAISKGTSDCAEGVNTLVTTMKQSPEAIQKQIDTILAQVKALAGVDSSEKLAAMISGIDEAIAANEGAAPIADVLSSATGGSITSYKTYSKLVEANYSLIALEGVKKTLSDTITANAESITKLASGMQTLKGATAALSTGIGTMYQGVTALSKGSGELAAGTTALKAGTAALAQSTGTFKLGTAKLVTGANTLNAGGKTFSNGLTTYVAGVGELSKGAAKLYKGSKTLNSGVGTLYNGIVTLGNGSTKLYNGTLDLNDGTSKLYNGTNDLKDGVNTLKNGSADLNEGMVKFDKNGVTKITSLLGDNLKDAADLLEAIKDQGTEYKNFSGISDGMDGEVKFIYKTNEIKKADAE